MDEPKYSVAEYVYWGDTYHTATRPCGPCTISPSGVVYFSELPVYKLNRTSGPSAVYPNGYISYSSCSSGFHRTDGPAVIHAEGNKEYYVNGKKIDQIPFFMMYAVT